MAERLAKSAEFTEYNAYHLTWTSGAPLADAKIDSTTHGHFLRGIVIGNAGTGTSIKVGNGTTTVTLNVQAILSPNTVSVFYPFDCAFDNGVFIAGTCSAGTPDITVIALPMAI